MADGLPPMPAALAPAAPRANADLRPLSTSELIDRGFSLYRAHFAGLFLLALLCQCAPLLTQFIVTGFRLNPRQSDLLDAPSGFAGKLAIIFAISLVSQFIVFCFEVVITHYVSDIYLGAVPSMKTSLRGLTRRVGACVWTCIVNRGVILLTCLFPALALGAVYVYALVRPPHTAFGVIGFCTVAGLLFIASLAPVLIAFMRLMLTIPALAIEGTAGVQAVRRSSTLVRFDPGLGFLYWGEMRLSFLLLPLFIIELMFLSLTSLPVTIHQAGEIMRHGSGGQIVPPPDSVLILSQVLTFLAGSLILPLYSIATTLFYYDVRIRREGFDVEFLTQQLEARS
jgi:hypothetical protein